MAELTVDLFSSLDGYAAGVGVGAYFGYGGPELDARIREVLAQPQLMLMGRVTYEALQPIVAAGADDASRRMDELPKAVFSNTLQEPLTWSNSRVLSGRLGERIAALKQESTDPIRTIGSLTLARELLRLGFADRLRITVFPLILGDLGREWVFAEHDRCDLKLVDTRVLDRRLIVLDYRPRADGA